MPFDETLSAGAQACPPRAGRQRAAMSPTGFSLAAFLVAAVLAGGPAPARAQDLQPLRGSSTLLNVGAPAALLPGLNAYGPGINADAAGRPYVFVTPLGAPLGGVSLNVYGPGIGADANGWPVYVRPWP
jgi:hypothetical protein